MTYTDTDLLNLIYDSCEREKMDCCEHENLEAAAESAWRSEWLMSLAGEGVKK